MPSVVHLAAGREKRSEQRGVEAVELLPVRVEDERALAAPVAAGSSRSHGNRGLQYPGMTDPCPGGRRRGGVGARDWRCRGDDSRPGGHSGVACGGRLTTTCARVSTDLRTVVQETVKRDPHCGHLFVFRGRRGDLIKCLWSDGQGLCLFAKRLERGRFLWPSTADGMVTISTAQLGYLLEGIDWRMPQKTWRPTAVG